jgi:hypothetical protein
MSFTIGKSKPAIYAFISSFLPSFGVVDVERTGIASTK